MYLRRVQEGERSRLSANVCDDHVIKARTFAEKRNQGRELARLSRQDGGTRWKRENFGAETSRKQHGLRDFATGESVWKMLTEVELTTTIFEKLQNDFQCPANQTRTLRTTVIGLAESVSLIVQLGLVPEWTQESKGSGVTLGHKAQFDAISQAASESDETGSQLEDTESTFTEESHDSSQSSLLMKKSEIRWQHAECLLLIELKKEHDSLFSRSTINKKQVWEMIARRMREKGHNYTGTDCDNKWRSLTDRYKKNKEKTGKTGRGRVKWPLYEKMDEYYYSDPAINPVARVASLSTSTVFSAISVVTPSLSTSTPMLSPPSSSSSSVSQNTPQRSSSSSPVSQTTPQQSSSSSSNSKTTPQQPKSPTMVTPKRKRRATDESVLLTLRDDLRKMHEERMEIERRRVETLEKIFHLMSNQSADKK